MKKISVFVLVIVILTLGVTVLVAQAAPPTCTTIQSGLLYDSAGNLIETGYAESGYNYQAHMFNGPHSGFDLVMKWNDAWLSNKDCDGDGKLDRHYGHATYIGSGAWETNHWTGEYLDANGEMCYWDEFYKIIAVPADAVKVLGVWYTVDGTEIGPDIWGQFAITQYVFNDPCYGVEGVQYLSPDHAGFGGW